MNLLHLKYAVEIEKTGSITKGQKIYSWDSLISARL